MFFLKLKLAKKYLDKILAWTYVRGQKNMKNFVETSFRGFAKKPRNSRKLIKRKLISAKMDLLKASYTTQQ